MGKFTGEAAPLTICPNLLLKIAESLFSQEIKDDCSLQTFLDVAVIPPVTTRVLEICGKLRDSNALDLGGISNKEPLNWLLSGDGTYL